MEVLWVSLGYVNPPQHSSFPTAVSSDFEDTAKDLQVNGSSMARSLSVRIVNDSAPEEEENFFAVLVTRDPSIVLAPSRATVIILDDDGRQHM